MRLTAQQFLLLARRRWYIIVLGMVLTFGLAGLTASRMPTVYWARTSVSVLLDGNNPLLSDGTPVAGLAAVLLEIRANDGATQVKTSSYETTLYGEGLLDGSRIRLRDTGGQWSTSIAEPVIYVEATGASPEIVTERINQRVGVLHEEFDRLQVELDVPPTAALALRANPARPSVVPLSGNRNRLLLAIGMLGAVLTALGVQLMDRSGRRQNPPRRAILDGPPVTPWPSGHGNWRARVRVGIRVK